MVAHPILHQSSDLKLFLEEDNLEAAVRPSGRRSGRAVTAASLIWRGATALDCRWSPTQMTKKKDLKKALLGGMASVISQTAGQFSKSAEKDEVRKRAVLRGLARWPACLTRSATAGRVRTGLPPPRLL